MASQPRCVRHSLTEMTSQMHKLLRSDSGCKGMGPSCKVWPWVIEGTGSNNLEYFVRETKSDQTGRHQSFWPYCNLACCNCTKSPKVQKSENLESWYYPWHWEWETRDTCSLRLHADWIPFGGLLKPIEVVSQVSKWGLILHEYLVSVVLYCKAFARESFFN